MIRNTPSKSYAHLAADWSPETSDAKKFWLLIAVVVIAFIVAAIVISVIDVPERDQRSKVKVSDRVAKFINEREKIEPPKPTPVPPPKVVPKPTPEPVVAEVVPEEKPRVVKQRREDKPLTDKEKAAREKASQSGLLALANEFADLQDSSSILSKVGGKTRASTGAAQDRVGGGDGDLLTAGVGRGSGGVSDGAYKAPELAANELEKLKVAKVDTESLARKTGAASATSSGGKTSRAEEDVSRVFDQNKAVLYSLYNRERRKNPGIKGKLILELKIDPSGAVSAIKIVSSELDSPSLEKRILARVKRFNFGAISGKTVTVNFPIEFLPS